MFYISLSLSVSVSVSLSLSNFILGEVDSKLLKVQLYGTCGLLFVCFSLKFSFLALYPIFDTMVNDYLFIFGAYIIPELAPIYLQFAYEFRKLRNRIQRLK